MLRHLLIALLLVAGGATLSCQSYSTGMQQSVARADETAALAAILAISKAQVTYSVSNNGSYGTFAQLVQSGSLDSRFSSEQPKVKGYVLTMTATAGSPPSYSVNADPEPTQAGRHFFLDSTSGLIHVNASQPATASDPTTGS
jgi:Tfp pilus assembly protein PilE